MGSMLRYTLTGLLVLAFSFAFCQNSEVTISEIKYPDNLKTRESTILRELEFEEGKSYNRSTLDSLFRKSERNLINTSLFNFVTIYSQLEGERTVVIVDLIERWYIWPYPLFEIADRNLNSWLQDKDYSRLNYGLFLAWENFTGRKDILKLLIRLGHEDKFGFFYQLPVINKAETLGIDLGISYARNYEVGVASVDDELVYYKESEEYARQQFNTFFSLIYRPEIHNKNIFKIEYNSFTFSDSLLYHYPNYSVNEKKKLKYFNLSYKLQSDYRDYKIYPLKGYYFDFEITKHGLGLLESNGVNFTSIETRFNFYKHISGKWYYAMGLSGKISSDNYQPYVLQRGLGYKFDYIRGYELYILDGKNYGLLKANLKFELMPIRNHTFSFINEQRFNKMHYAFYLNLFADFGYVKDSDYSKLNTLTNAMQYSLGIGLDFVTYYDIVFRTEYSINRQKETFLFFHLKAPI